MVTEDQIKRDAETRKLFGRLQAKNRLLALLATARDMIVPQRERELQAVREYHREWREFLSSYRTRLGLPSGCSWISKRSEEVRTASEYLERSDRWVMEQVDQAVMEDLVKRTDGEAMRAAVLNRLLNHRMPARVFRSGRLIGVSLEEVDQLADRAEGALVEILKARGVPL